MDNRKFEQLIDLIINENEEQAKELFHDIVVEKSKEIYENIMQEEMMDMDDDLEEDMGGQVGDLLDEINAEEEGVAEAEDDDIEVDSEEVFDIDGDEEESSSSEEVEDAVIRIEDKLDELMAEFEELMGKADGEEEVDMEVDMDTPDMDMDMEADEEVVAEAVQLQKVGVQYPHGGDNGENTRSPVDANSGKAGMDSRPVDFARGDEKGRPAPKAKDVDGASSFQNVPGKKNVKLDNAPKPVTSQASGVNNKSVID
jgi:hypothetical protein